MAVGYLGRYCFTNSVIWKLMYYLVSVIKLRVFWSLSIFHSYRIIFLRAYLNSWVIKENEPLPDLKSHYFIMFALGTDLLISCVLVPEVIMQNIPLLQLAKQSTLSSAVDNSIEENSCKNQTVFQHPINITFVLNAFHHKGKHSVYNPRQLKIHSKQDTVQER